METWMIVTLVIVLVVIAVLVALYIFGSKMQKKQEKAQADMMVGAQTYSILVIDKKRRWIKDRIYRLCTKFLQSQQSRNLLIRIIQ